MKNQMLDRLNSTSLTLLLSLMGCLVAALYWPGLAGPFLFDDGPALTDNHYLRIDGRQIDEWRTASVSSDSGLLRRPISMFSFAANVVAADGVKAFPIKLGNLGIHLMCGLLVFLFAKRVLMVCANDKDKPELIWAAILAAALWLLAPLHVSTVLYAVQRMTQLSALFVLMGLVVFVYRRSEWEKRGASAGELIATSFWLGLCTLMATLSKENGALLLWLLPAIEVSLFRGRWAGRDSASLQGLGWVALITPLLLVAAILLWVPGILLGGYAGREFSVEERLLTQLRLLWQYLSWMVYPDINAMGFQHDDIEVSLGWLQPVSTTIAAVGWLALLLFSFARREKFPLLLLAVLIYLVGHFMESGVWPLEMVYEHRNYLPSVGVYVLLASALVSTSQRQSLFSARIVGFAIIAACSTLLFLRVFTWSEPMRLSAVNVSNHPMSSRSHFFFAQSWLRAYSEALEKGEDDEDIGNYLVLARNEFELMYLQNKRDMAAIVMLYYLDQHHFKELQLYNDWFTLLEQLAYDRPLQASDFNALESLLDCFSASICTESRERLFGLIDILEQRYPNNSRLALLRYRYLKSIDAPVAERVSLLQNVKRTTPWNNHVYQHLLIEQADIGDVTGLYETVLMWMLHDPQRRQLGVIHKLFEHSEAEGTAALSGPSGAEA